jgi:hypothetical protein
MTTPKVNVPRDHCLCSIDHFTGEILKAKSAQDLCLRKSTSPHDELCDECREVLMRFANAS